MLSVRLTPKSSIEAIEKPLLRADGSSTFVARVRAAPENGQANKALLALVAETLGCPKSAVSLESGTTSRIKTLHIARPYHEVEARLLVLGLL